QADYLIPAPAHLESLEEVATPCGASSASFSLSTPLMTKSENTVEPIEFVQKLADAAGISGLNISTTEVLLKQRVQTIHDSKRGTIFSSVDGTTSNLSDIKSADELWTALTNGVWIDNPAKQIPQAKFSLLGNIPPSSFEMLAQSKSNLSDALVLMPFGWRGATSTGLMSPIMSKLFQESDMRSLAGHAFVNPKTAASQGLEDGDTAELQTQNGTTNVFVKTDAKIMPGVIHAAVGPSPNKSETQDHFNGEGVLALCTVQDNGTWRLTEATLKNVKA
ncbi:MAG: molybdopterin dinucleotide binding domain-containing protein, partial [bacterium]